jgi:hypothetical protein
MGYSMETKTTAELVAIIARYEARYLLVHYAIGGQHELSAGAEEYAAASDELNARLPRPVDAAGGS